MSIDLGFIGAQSQARAQRDATSAQAHAIKKQREFLFENLDPEKMGVATLAADQARARNQLALQKELDPNLVAARNLATSGVADELAKNGVQAKAVADRAVQEATTGPQTIDQKNALIDAAMAQLKQGAKLPPDVQAELVQSGLEASGMATGRSTAQGMGGTMLRTILGQAGINLQMQRQQQAQSLLASASNLEAQRQGVLNSLFPNLSALQSQNMARSETAFNMSQAGMPNAGMTGTDVANIWLARVGAANSLTQQAGNNQAQSALAQGQIMSNAMGSAGVNLNQAIDIGRKVWPKSTAPGGSSGWTPNTGGGGLDSVSAGADYGGEMDAVPAGGDFAG